MMRNIARALTVALVGAGGLVACSNDQEACAAAPAAKLPNPSRTTIRPTSTRTTTTRTTSKVQDRPTSSKTTERPTTWSGYNDRVKQRNWSKPYREGFPTPQQPVIIHHYGHDYRTYPGYGGFYSVGVWPIGYGDRYGCHTDNEAAPEPTETSAPVPTVTVTETATPTQTQTPSPSPFPMPTETPSSTPAQAPDPTSGR